MTVTSKQRQFLRGLAHPLEPVVRVGKGGVTDAVVEETKKSLAAHELIKVRIESDDSDFQMPPGSPLGAAERCAIIQWVEAGAER